jgi:biopolymer transport protein ExbB
MLTIISSSGWTIWPLLFVSIIGLAILLERTWFLRRKKISPTENLEQALTYLKTFLVGQSINPVHLESLEQSSPLGKILAKGLQAFLGRSGQLDCLEVMRETATPILGQLNQYLSTLATIATIAPLMGLFGTVLGMIEIFSSQGTSGSPQQLAQGISMALYNTAFGLLIAIPALAGWRYLRGLADTRAQELNDATRILLKNMFPQ